MHENVLTYTNLTMIGSAPSKPVQFGLRDLFWVIAVVGLLTVWLIDRGELGRLRKQNAVMLESRRARTSEIFQDRIARDFYWHAMLPYMEKQVLPDPEWPYATTQHLQDRIWWQAMLPYMEQRALPDYELWPKYR